MNPSEAQIRLIEGLKSFIAEEEKLKEIVTIEENKEIHKRLK